MHLWSEKVCIWCVHRSSVWTPSIQSDITAIIFSAEQTLSSVLIDFKFSFLNFFEVSRVVWTFKCVSLQGGSYLSGSLAERPRVHLSGGIVSAGSSKCDASYSLNRKFLITVFNRRNFNLLCVCVRMCVCVCCFGLGLKFACDLVILW